MGKPAKKIRYGITELIKNEIESLNPLFLKGAEMAGKEIAPFSLADYKHLEESKEFFGLFSLPYYLTYATYKDIKNRSIRPIPGKIWYWLKEADQNITKDFLPAQVKLLTDTLESYMALLKAENFLQALILFRSYIEYSSQLYASLMDYDFFQKYTGMGVMDEEYKRLWFSSLKPAKVLETIRNMNAEINKLLKEKKIVYGKNAQYRREFQPFDSKLRGLLYKDLSGLAHGSHRSLTRNDDVKLYALVWLCTSYLVESQAVIDELMSVYFKYEPTELFHKWVAVEIYKKSFQKGVEIYLDDNT